MSPAQPPDPTTTAPAPRRRGRPPRALVAAPGAAGVEAGEDHAGEAPGARERLIRAGLMLLTEKGYTGVGLDELLRAAQVPKGSFYHCFASKEAYGQAVVDAYAAYFARLLDRCLLDDSRPPLARLRHFVDEARAGMRRHDFRRGCLVGNLGQEMGVLPESFRARLAAVLADWEARTERCLALAQAAGEVTTRLDAATLAHLFWIGWEGAVLRAKLERSDTPLALYAQGWFTLLGREA